MIFDIAIKFQINLGFPMACDSATFQDKGTEVLSLSRDKGKAGLPQNLAKGRGGTSRDSLSKSRTGR